MDRKTRTQVTNQLEKLLNDIIYLYPALEESPFLTDEQKELARNMKRDTNRLYTDLKTQAEQQGFKRIDKMR